MRTVEHVVTQLIVHSLIRAPGTPSRLVLRDAPCALDGAALRLVERLCAQYESRAAKGFGRFEEDHEAFPLARWLGEHVIDETLDFATLSRQFAERVQAIADEEELEDGGHLVVARVREGDTDTLWTALLGAAEGVSINGTLDLLDCTHIDFAALHAAGRVDLSGWRRGDERYLGFLRGRGKGGAWFKRVLGCSDVMVALQETIPFGPRRHFIMDLVAVELCSLFAKVLGSDPATSGFVTNLTDNFGERSFRGIDLGVNYRFDALGGRFATSLQGSYLLEQEITPLPGVNEDATYDCAGLVNPSCQSPEWRHIANVRYSRDWYTVNLRWRHFGSMDYILTSGAVGTGDTLTAANGGIDAYNYFDLSASAYIGEYAELTVGVNNIADKEPPLVGGNLAPLNGNSLGGYDQAGRYFFTSVTFKF